MDPLKIENTKDFAEPARVCSNRFSDLARCLGSNDVKESRTTGLESGRIGFERARIAFLDNRIGVSY